MKLFMFLMCLSFTVNSKETKNLPITLEYDSSEYFLCKEHTIKYAYIIKIVHVGLYLKDCSMQNNLLTIDDKLVRFNYQLDIKAKVFSEAAEKFYIKNLKNSDIDNTLEELKKFNALYVAMSDSDSYDLFHTKDGNLKLFKNKNLLGSSYNKTFSTNYFNIWFGKFPADKKLRNTFI